MYEDAGSGTAYLSLIKENTKLYAIDGCIPVTVVKDDVSTFSAQFQCGRDESFGSGNSNVPSNLCGSGESKLAKSRMLEKVLT